MQALCDIICPNIVLLFDLEQAYPVLVDHNQNALLKLTENQVFNNSLCLNGDITDPDFIATIMTEAVEKFGKIDGLVNSAALLLPEDGDIAQTPLTKTW